MRRLLFDSEARRFEVNSFAPETGRIPRTGTLIHSTGQFGFPQTLGVMHHEKMCYPVKRMTAAQYERAKKREAKINE